MATRPIWIPLRVALEVLKPLVWRSGAGIVASGRMWLQNRCRPEGVVGLAARLSGSHWADLGWGKQHPIPP
jgi:hypothetical protein